MCFIAELLQVLVLLVLEICSNFVIAVALLLNLQFKAAKFK